MEIWKDVPGYEDSLEISNLGNVKTKRRLCSGGYYVGGGSIAIRDNGHGYMKINHNINGKQKVLYIHRLVAMAFIDNPNSLPCVNHINECKADNRVENLEWVDYKTNNTYGSLPERKRERQIEIKGRKVTRYNLDGSVSKSYICTNDVEKDGYNRRQIDSCCKGKCKTSYGYVWRYDSDPFSLESRFIGVAKYDMSGNLVCCYESIMKAERENGLSKHAIRNYHKGIRKSNIINNYRYEILNNSTQTSGLEFRRKQNINK